MSDVVPMTELITQDYLRYKLQKSGYDFESFSKWPTVHCQTCKSKLETEVITHCDNCDDTKMFSVPEEKSDKAPCQRELKFTRKVCDLFQNDFEKRFDIDTANINTKKATVQITILQEADDLFQKGTKWKGIVGLLILSGVLAKRCAENGYISEVKSIQCITSWYINEKLGPWMKEHGGWESFFLWAKFIIEFYKPEQFKERNSQIIEYTSETQRRLKMYLDSTTRSKERERLRVLQMELGQLQILAQSSTDGFSPATIFGSRKAQSSTNGIRPATIFDTQRPRVQQMDSVPLQSLESAP